MSTSSSTAPVVAAAITGSATFLAAAVAAFYARQAASRTRRWDKHDRARRYREPLLHAAFNLQSRIWNIHQQSFLDDFLVAGSPREQQYARANTVYLIAQYLYWAELIRQEAQYLTPGRRRRQTKLIVAMEHTRHALADSQEFGTQPFRIFRGDQRALAELMSVPDSIDYSVPEHNCRGYADFLNALYTNQNFESWFQPLLGDVDRVAADLATEGPRLRELQHSLLKLIKLIDRWGRSVPKDQRKQATV